MGVCPFRVADSPEQVLRIQLPRAEAGDYNRSKMDIFLLQAAL